MEEYRSKILNSHLSKDQKRALLRKLDNNSLSSNEISMIEDPQPAVAEKPNHYKNLYLQITYIISGAWFFKYITVMVILILLWWFYVTPGGIKVRAFPLTVWKIRTSLDILQKQATDFHKLVIENTDEINVDYIDLPHHKWGHAFVKNWVQVVRLFHPHQLEIPYLTQLLVHEACHGHQWIHSRFWAEPQQKLESECHYLWIYITETLFPDDVELLDYLYSEATKEDWMWWDGWKKNWEWWDTTKWLSKLLPEEKIIEYKYFWNSYKY